jgi:molybdopterin molybdotransferase
MRPGKPLIHGHLGRLPLLGLPGNPVSALITAILFLLPALARLSGLPGDPPAVSSATLGATLPANDQRADHLRARLHFEPDGTVVATAFDRQDSAMLRLLTQSDALILRPPHAPALEAGATVPIIRLDLLGA